MPTFDPTSIPAPPFRHCRRRHEQRLARGVQYSEDRIEALPFALAVSSAPEWWLQRRRALVRPTPRFSSISCAGPATRKRILRTALAVDLEPAESAPERDARLSVADEQFGDEVGIHGL